MAAELEEDESLELVQQCNLRLKEESLCQKLFHQHRMEAEHIQQIEAAEKVNEETN